MYVSVFYVFSNMESETSPPYIPNKAVCVATPEQHMGHVFIVNVLSYFLCILCL